MGQPYGLAHHYVHHSFDELVLFLKTLLFCCFPWHALGFNAHLVVNEEIQAKASSSVFEEEDGNNLPMKMIKNQPLITTTTVRLQGQRMLLLLQNHQATKAMVQGFGKSTEKKVDQ